ncbi:MAG TPA: hypothetical protein VMK83_04755 [Gaiellaceae bacterium]|nr:hypothetical protein [Gaiellaceae bacterium]
MRLNRTTVGALAVSATLLVSGGAAFAASGDGSRGAARCEERLAKAADKRGVSAEQLQATIEARLLARIDAAEKAGRISNERAAKLRERAAEATACGARKQVKARLAHGGMLKAATVFLGLDRAQLRQQLPGNSLVGLAEQQGKSAAALRAAMVAPAKARLAKAVADGKVTQARADKAAERLDKLADRLASKVFSPR